MVSGFIWCFFVVLPLKALRHVSHSFTCKLHHACLYLVLVSVHKMAIPLAGGVHLIAAYYSSIDPEWMSWPGWLTYSGRFALSDLIDSHHPDLSVSLKPGLNPLLPQQKTSSLYRS